MQVYFDNAATTPLIPQVKDEIISMLDIFGNPSSIHQKGREAKIKIESSRKKIAQLLHVSPSEIIFTSGGTEAINFILKQAVLSLGIKHIITSPIEHHAVLNTIQSLKLSKIMI